MMKYIISGIYFYTGLIHLYVIARARSVHDIDTRPQLAVEVAREPIRRDDMFLRGLSGN